MQMTFLKVSYNINFLNKNILLLKVIISYYKRTVISDIFPHVDI